MAKMINKLNDEMLDQVGHDFMKLLKSSRLTDGKFTFERVFKNDERARVYFTPSAYNKMVALISYFSTEVGWHGTTERLGDNKYLITDIVVYPQKVTSVNATTDNEEYRNWLNGIDDDTFNQLKMHGHSHVTMGVSPSQTDINDQQKILRQMKDGMFYIFMIWNKRMEFYCVIYDYMTNLLFETSDISVQIYDESNAADGFVDSIKELVRTSTPAPATKVCTANNTWKSTEKEKDKKNYVSAASLSAQNKNSGSTQWSYEQEHDPFYAYDGFDRKYYNY